MLAVTLECPSEFSLPSRILKLNGLALTGPGGGGGGPTLGVDMTRASKFSSAIHTTGGSGAGARPECSRPILDPVEYGLDCAASISAGSSAYASLRRGEFGAHESCAGGSLMEFLFHVGVTQEHPGEVGSSSSAGVEVFDHHLGSTTNQCDRALEIRVDATSSMESSSDCGSGFNASVPG